jgi:hypothetical protein
VRVGSASGLKEISQIFKLATASASKNLGTGENDFAVQNSLGRSFGGFNTSLTLGYTYVGKPKGGNYQNAFYGTPMGRIASMKTSPRV